MVRQPVVQTEAREPADREVDLRFAHQTSVVNDAEKEPREHQADRGFRINPRSTDPGCVRPDNLLTQPTQVENMINAGEDVLVGNEIA